MMMRLVYWMLFVVALALVCALLPGCAHAGTVNVLSPGYGAQCNGSNDDTAGLLAAVADAQRTRSTLYVPSGAICRTNESLVFTSMTGLKGDGPNVSWLMYCGQGDAVIIRPSVSGADNSGQQIESIGILPCVPGGGQYGIHVELAPGAFYSDFDIDRVNIGDFGTRALWLDNRVGNRDGIFTGRISRSVLRNGVLADGLGDSVAFLDNKITGHGNVLLRGLAGAAGSSIVGGQITTSQGFLILVGVESFRVERVWMESPGPWHGGDTAIQLADTIDAQFMGNVIDPITSSIGPAQVFGMMGATRGTVLRDNRVISPAQAAEVYGTSSVSGTTVEPKAALRVVLQGS